MDVDPSVSEDSQNGRTDKSKGKKPSHVEAVPRLDIKTSICWMDGSAYNTNPSTGTSTPEIGPYDDLVPSQVSLKERVEDGCRSCFSLDTLKKLFPIIVWLPEYNFLKLAFDLVAGITVGVTIIPQALAFAGIAGLAPQYGLYSGIICCFVYVLMGSAKDITLGPSAITSLLTAAFATSLSPKLPNGDTDPTMAIMLTLTTGLIHIFMGVCQLGIMVSFISFPVINAFSSAAAVTIAVSQLGSLLGLAGVPNEFIASLDNIRTRIPDINVWDMVMGLACIVAVFTIKGLRCIKFKDNIDKTTPKYILLARQTLHICASEIDVFPYLVTFASTLLIGVQWGIFVGVGVSLLILLYPIARPKLLFSSVQGFMVVTPTSGLTFPSAEYLEIKALDKALDVDKPSHVILNMEHLSFMDFSGIQAIKSLLAECEVNEIKLILAQGQKRVRRQLKLAHITNLIIVQTVQEAINKFTLEMTLDESRDGDGHYVVRSCMTRL